MADKVSTIRFKVEGSQAATDVEKLARTIQAQELRVSRATLKAQTADTLESQQKLFNEKAKMERLYSDVAFAASHTRAEYDLMVFDRTLQAQLAKFRNNEKAYNAIAAQGAIERAKIEQGAGGSMGGALSGFGGKMILAHAMGIAGGDILGDQHGGRELGALAGAAMFGGPGTVAVVAGIEIIGTTFRTLRADAEAARKAAEDYGNTLEDIGERWVHLATASIERNPFGKAMETEFEHATSAVRKYKDEASKIRQTGISVWNALMHGAGITDIQQSGPMLAYKAALGMSYSEQISAGMAKYFRDEEYPKQIEAQEKLAKLQEQNFQNTYQMEPGFQKEREVILGKQADEELKRLERQREENALMEATVIMAKTAQQQKEAETAQQQKWDEHAAENMRVFYENRREILKLEQEITREGNLQAEAAEKARISNQKRIQSEMASFDATAAKGAMDEKLKEFYGIGATDSQVDALKEQMLVGNYIKQTEQERLELKLSEHQITEKEYYLQSMMLKDIRSQWKGAEGDRIRKAMQEDASVHAALKYQQAINEMDRAMERIKDEYDLKSSGKGRMEHGEFSTNYQFGYVDFSVLRTRFSGGADGKANQWHQQYQMYQRMLDALLLIAHKDGLN